MTPAEIQREYQYRIQERAAILTDGDPRPLTPDEHKLCLDDAAEWLARYRSQQEPQQTFI